ncbi:hypothetical protein ACHABQ_13690 [Nesterenkonia aurantiaca]|uniref:hypothetical protein n=1 Tax=Nesterenkonia aurantiaca TaxID=1436010 RepID=UPI003EE4DF25
MSKVTQHFSIVGPVPFCDVDVVNDTALFIDPHRIRLSPTNPWRGQAVAHIDQFFNFVSDAVMSSNPALRTRAKDALTKFREPRETHLGYSARGSQGHGAALKVGNDVWEAFNVDLRALLEVGVLKRLEHLPLFVAGVGRDITSDITTRIIFSTLVNFTTEMVRRYPQLGGGAKGLVDYEVQVWDAGRLEWGSTRVKLPSVDGTALVLVPQGWVGGDLEMSSTRFYETSLLSYMQDIETIYRGDGRPMYPRKDDLKKRRDLVRGRDTHLAVTQMAHNNDDNLIERFERFVLEQFDADKYTG